MNPGPLFGGLVRRRECLTLTRRGWLVLLVVAFLLSLAALLGVQPFLAVTEPAPGGILVVEGWQSDYAMEQVVAEFKKHDYRLICVVGGPLERGAPLSEYKSFAGLGAAVLMKMGLGSNVVHPVPTPEVRKDRTYASAVEMKKWLDQEGIRETRFNLMSLGVHSRRSRLLFQWALGATNTVGIVAIESRGYNPHRWWTSSEGVRTVTGEWTAYCYARLLFRPDPGP